jgi:3-phenylpropionate/trans-cinnamate dioxygenase ferredoxin subunit
LADGDYVKVASLDTLPPGEMMHVEIGGREIMLVNVDGVVHACSDLCPHQFSRLSYGDLDGAEVSCPLHGAIFNVVTGEQLPGKYSEFGPVLLYEVQLDGSDILVQRPAQ